MPYGSPFEDVLVKDGTPSVQLNGEWAVLQSLNGIAGDKIAMVAGAVSPRDDAESMMKTNLTEVMDAVDAPLQQKVCATLRFGDTTQDVELECPSLVVERLEEKIAAVTQGFAGVIGMSKLLGNSDKDVTTAYMLAAADGPDMSGMDPMAAMAAQMGAAAMGGMGGAPQGGAECKQQ
uniref:Uncharacterized protein n=1 Tax=Neobodo designis TaxID=312471 RepID=A0A7S1QVL7_NEODS|eukprot:CAMPEP_0174852120 /NCGR_PEP_ID=MMETSP1114-20130205/25198_1 /TAXON_ID=312471 /ORGANISM="Neobodo designis, Strain CCAP 1951/1" /LENGTH=176 /DNA_ID=CAMNT_0016086699 /DNA_START=28 /DNA_END=558 /DNA_ORIENTATION=+